MSQRTFEYNPPKVPFLDVLHEDDDIMVVNKPSTILSVPGKKSEHRDSILSRVKSIYENAFAVHRLDYGTSGVMVVGLNKPAISNLGKQFESRHVHKVYVAWVDGELTGVGAVNLPLIYDMENRPRQKIDFEVGKQALTFYEGLYYDSKLNRSFVRLYPQTGRSHQLRVHMASLGHSILGDHLYASDEVYECVPHLYLHAALLSFTHPSTNEPMRFSASAPFDVPEGIEFELSWLEEDLEPRVNEVKGPDYKAFYQELVAPTNKRLTKAERRALKAQKALKANSSASND